MKEILFRGKRIDGKSIDIGKWIEGFYFVATDIMDDNIHHYIIETEAELYPHGEVCGIYEVDPSTVGQCTGLVDNNGKKIFDGDILFCTREIGMGYREFRGKVVYKAPKFYVDCENTVLTLDCDNGKPDFIILGNIYDNLDLLEVKR